MRSPVKMDVQSCIYEVVLLENGYPNAFKGHFLMKNTFRKSIKIIVFGLIFLLVIIAVLYHLRIGTGRYCTESPELRWKFAIYAGECTDLNDGNDCSFYKIPDTGLLEYLGLRDSPLQKAHCY